MSVVTERIRHAAGVASFTSRRSSAAGALRGSRCGQCARLMSCRERANGEDNGGARRGAERRFPSISQ